MIDSAEIIRAEMAEIDFSFGEIVIVSDGVAGSMASIFTSTISQFSKNSNRTGANTKVTTVAYGEFHVKLGPAFH